jgi:hypothetical protein
MSPSANHDPTRRRPTEVGSTSLEADARSPRTRVVAPSGRCGRPRPLRDADPVHAHRIASGGGAPAPTGPRVPPHAFGVRQLRPRVQPGRDPPPDPELGHRGDDRGSAHGPVRVVGRVRDGPPPRPDGGRPRRGLARRVDGADHRPAREPVRDVSVRRAHRHVRTPDRSIPDGDVSLLRPAVLLELPTAAAGAVRSLEARGAGPVRDVGTGGDAAGSSGDGVGRCARVRLHVEQLPGSPHLPVRPEHVHGPSRSAFALDARRAGLPAHAGGAVTATVPVILVFVFAQRFFLREFRGVGWLGT